MASAEIVGRLMRALRQGDRGAGRELVSLFYPELRRLAAAQMKEQGSAHTWQPTALVHELYLELIRTKKLSDRDYGDQERAAFFGLAGQMMRRLLIHHARPLHRRVQHADIDETGDIAARADPLHQVEDALDRLAAIDLKLRSVVEMKVFEDLTGDEIAERLGCSRRTVANYWNIARRWLQKEWAGAQP
jgi:RNA polymerase sigma factor (TIGR02999 family)